jgi:hypothetical protein
MERVGHSFVDYQEEIYRTRLRRSILPSPNNPLAHSRKLDGSGVELGTTESDKSVEVYVRFHTSPVGAMAVS